MMIARNWKELEAELLAKLTPWQRENAKRAFQKDCKEVEAKKTHED